MTILTIHLVSDIHLEFRAKVPSYLNQIKADILVLAGDIGNFSDPSNESCYANFIKECASLFKHVIVVSGNHEYYSDKLNMYQIDNKIKEIVDKYDNVYFLQRSSVVIGDVEFIGCTLWSDQRSNQRSTRFGSDQRSNPLVETGKFLINDFNKIKYMSVPTYKQLFQTDLKYLTEKLSNYNDKKIVVITHHLPSYELVNEKYKDDPSSCYFASNLDYLVDKADYWLSGHTHIGTFKEIGNCKCYVNPYGYPFEKQTDTMFDGSLIITI